MQPLSPVQAQQRADDIQAYRREARRLSSAGVHQPAPEQQSSIDDYHDRLLREYGDRYLIDTDQRAKRLSLGMRLASFIGAVALSAAAVFLFYQFWGFLSEIQQSAILAAASIGMLLLTAWLNKRDRFGYFCRLSALITLACFVLNIVMLGQIYNILSSDMPLLPWIVLAFLLAYGCRSPLLLAVGLTGLTAFIATRITVWNGWQWENFLLRPENLFIGALLIFILPLVVDQRRFGRWFAETYRLVGSLTFFLSMLFLATSGQGSYLPFTSDTVENVYQLAGFILAALLIWWGIRRGWNESVNTGMAFFTIFLYIKLFDWWWELLPKYQFFFIIGIIALAILWALTRLRAMMKRETAQ